MEKEEKVKEQIKFKIEILRLGVVALLTIGGGTVSLINEGQFTGRSNFFIATGILVSFGLIGYLYNTFQTIKHLTK